MRVEGLNHSRWLLSHEIWHLLLLLLKILGVIPAPLLDKIVNDELYAPASLFVYLIYDGQNFFLFWSRDEAFASMVNRAKRNACYAPRISLALSYKLELYYRIYLSLT